MSCGCKWNDKKTDAEQQPKEQALETWQVEGRCHVADWN